MKTSIKNAISKQLAVVGFLSASLMMTACGGVETAVVAGVAAYSNGYIAPEIIGKRVEVDPALHGIVQAYRESCPLAVCDNLVNKIESIKLTSIEELNRHRIGQNFTMSAKGLSDRLRSVRVSRNVKGAAREGGKALFDGVIFFADGNEVEDARAPNYAASFNGFDVNVTDQGEHLSDFFLKDAILGLCFSSELPSIGGVYYSRITIAESIPDIRYYEMTGKFRLVEASEELLRITLFHELTHCAFGMNHNDSKLSIMNSMMDFSQVSAIKKDWNRLVKEMFEDADKAKKL